MARLTMKQRPVTLYLSAAICDSQGTVARPGAVAVRHGRIIAAGKPDDIPRRWRQGASVIDLPDDLLMPALVNAHAHLDLSGLGPITFPGNFIDWLKQIIERRPTDPGEIGKAVRRGLTLSREAGVGYVADVAGSVHAIHARLNSPADVILPGVSYLECVGIGQREAEAMELVERMLAQLPFETPVPGYDRGVVLGIEPHAPYSTGRRVYEQATQLSRRAIYRLTTHLAESKEEIEFVKEAGGPFAELLKSIDKWDDSIKASGDHPIDWLEPELRRGRWLLAHCNYVEDRHIETLQRTGTSVVYCPVASDYFKHTGHRYREMLDAAVNVCLGTDALVCQATDDPQPLGIFSQMRYLYRRDKTDPYLLLRMATTNGMLALEFSESDATLSKRAPAHFATVRIDRNDPRDPLEQALLSDQPVKAIAATRRDTLADHE